MEHEVSDRNEWFKDVKRLIPMSSSRRAPRCGVEPKMEDVRERSLTKPNVMSVKCPACGMSNSIAWGSMDLPPFRQAVAMLADSWNSR